MRLTRECDYAFVVLAFLAGRGGGGPISCEEIARALAIPPEFLAKILQKLARSELVASKQGALGGYALPRKPSEISFADVFRAIDNPMRLVECVDLHDCRCPRLSVCTIIGTMQAVHDKIMAEFMSVTLADLLPTLPTEPTSPEEATELLDSRT